MNIDKGMMDNQRIRLPYDQPNFKKYGTMKEFTLGSSGSGGDAVGQNDRSGNGSGEIGDDTSGTGTLFGPVDGRTAGFNLNDKGSGDDFTGRAQDK